MILYNMYQVQNCCPLSSSCICKCKQTFCPIYTSKSSTQKKLQYQMIWYYLGHYLCWITKYRIYACIIIDNVTDCHAITNVRYVGRRAIANI